MKGKSVPARFCIVALGKLGSRELNYSSDIDLLFLYSNEGTTTGSGNRGAVTNREYFIKLAEYTTKLVGQQTGEGAAYRVDLRLRPHGSLGALALSVADMVRYCATDARAWERQVLIRSRGCAGDTVLFKKFFGEVEDLIFSKDETVGTALSNVRRSKERIDLENVNRRGFNVKLGRGGIREIEFLAQALQLAYGGRDVWLRAPHTLISLSRLADRHHLTAAELSELSSAYEFLRRTEHVLQMENGVQTHTVPDEIEKRALLSRRMTFSVNEDFESCRTKHTANVSRIYTRVFGEIRDKAPSDIEISELPDLKERTLAHVMASLDKSNVGFAATKGNVTVLDRLTAVSPHFSAMIAANPDLVRRLPDAEADFAAPDYASEMMSAVDSDKNFGRRLSAMRRTWSHLLFQIVVGDIFDKISIRDAKNLQTDLAEASIAAALRVVRDELVRTTCGSGRLNSARLSSSRTSNIRDEYDQPPATVGGADLTVLALGKLGGRGLDYDSDLDLILVYNEDANPAIPQYTTAAEFYGRAAELFVTTLSSMTRDGNLYRVDLRLRPYGSKGLSAMPGGAFLSYMSETAAIWEMLAFVKLRAAGGDMVFAKYMEKETRRIIHERAVATDPNELRAETKRVRLALEKQRTNIRRGSEIDIKYGSGGMLDIYFAMRYLQLRDNVPDDPINRSTPFMLEHLLTNGSLDKSTHAELAAGYEFLSALDHNLRLTIGRTTRVPLANHPTLQTIASRLDLKSPADLLFQLTLHRLAIRSAFDQITGT